MLALHTLVFDVGTTHTCMSLMWHYTHLSLAISMQYSRLYGCGCRDQMRLQSAINNYTIVIVKQD